MMSRLRRIFGKSPATLDTPPPRSAPRHLPVLGPVPDVADRAKQTPEAAEQRADAGHKLPANPQDLYETDSSSRNRKQAEAVKRSEDDDVDRSNVIEEFQYLATRQKREWKNLCTIVLAHMLKIEHARPGTRGFTSWEDSIKSARGEMVEAVKKHRGMTGPEMDIRFAAAWLKGRKAAIEDLRTYEGELSDLTGKELKSLEHRRERELEELIPDECPWSLVEVAGNDPRHKVSAASVNDQILPAAVAKRLNRELKGREYPECGWIEGDYKNPVVPRDQADRKADLSVDRARLELPGPDTSPRAYRSTIDPGHQSSDHDRDLGPSR